MFSENLKTLRKQKGFSQEELATRLHVVRQTISKWEKNISVPDAEIFPIICVSIAFSNSFIKSGGKPVSVNVLNGVSVIRPAISQ